MYPFYAVRCGRRIGIFNNWYECQQSVNRYSNNEYKGFNTYEEAEKYMYEISTYNIYTDGACSGNPGPAAIGIIVHEPNEWGGNGNIIYKHSKMVGDSTNIKAAYEAVLYALNWAKSKHIQCINVHTDCKLIIQHINDEAMINDPIIQQYFNQIMDLFSFFRSISIQHTYTNNIGYAQQLSRERIQSWKREIQINTEQIRIKFYLLSTATCHFINDKRLFTSFQLIEPRSIMYMPYVYATVNMVGTVQLTPDSTLVKVYYIPNAQCNAISIAQLTSRNYMVVMDSNKAMIFEHSNSNQCVMTIPSEDQRWIHTNIYQVPKHGFQYQTRLLA